MKVTVFRNIFDTTEPLFVDVVKIFSRIKDGNSKEIIEKIRGLKDKDKKNDLKKRLPSVCFSGRFGKREAEFLLEHSGLICLDIDDLKESDLDAIKAEICKDEYVHSCFLSPGGMGFKVIIKIAPDKANHKGQFLALERHFNKFLNNYESTNKKQKKVCIDRSGKDINRVCYESYDPDIFYHPDSDMWHETYEEKRVENDVDDYEIVIKKLQKWIDNKESYYDGNRNQFLYQFSSAMCRYGISEMRAMSYLHSNYGDYPFAELETTVKGAYKANDFGTEKFTESQKKNQITTIKINSTKPVTSFWSINEKGKVKIDSKQLLKFIEANGFGIYMSNEKDKNWQFVRVNNMIVDIVDVIFIKKEILKYVEENAPEPVFEELQMRNRYFEKSYLNALKFINVEQIIDKEDSSYIFFEDFYYEINKKESIKKEYIDLEGTHIWRSQVCKQNIEEIVDYSKHDFNLFVYNAMEKDIDRYKAACAAIGYGIHTFKMKSVAKLIYTCDEGVGELDGMAMGGTGKNLFLECLSYVRSVVMIDGKDFDKRDKFKFQTVGDDTQIISIDDYESDIKELFTRITGHFEVERKGLDKTVLDFEKSPKIYVSSNSAPKGFSSSFSRRLYLIEFSGYYNEAFTPSDEFNNKDFFSNRWNQEDWNALYSFLFSCVRYYFNFGLKQQKIDSKNIKMKQLYKNVGREFAEWYEDNEINDFIVAKDFYDMYKSASDDDCNSQQFYGKIRKMCGIYGWTFVSKGKGLSKEIKIIK